MAVDRLAENMGPGCALPSLSRVRLFATPGLQLARLLCPWDSPGKSTGGGCHALLQIFLTQGSNPRLLHFLHLQADYLPLCTWEAIFKEMSHAVDKLERQKQELGFSTAASAYLFSLSTDGSE